jgi:hypothetical protein
MFYYEITIFMSNIEVQKKIPDIWVLSYISLPVPVTARSKAYVYGHTPAAFVGSNPIGELMFVVCVVCCQVEVSATRWSLVERSPNDCGASLCVIKKPRETGRS